MAWTKEQELAINTVGTNIIVSAGAGSGKTAVLTTRVMRHIHNGIHIDELLILTFTNAAAGEMKERIEKNLKKENNQEELKRLSNAYITTFDSYASSIVKKYHYLLNLPKNIVVANDALLRRIKKEVLDNIFEDYYKENNPSFSSLINMLCIKNDDDLKSEILALANKLEIKTDLNNFLDTYLDTYYNDSVYQSITNDYYNILNNKISELEVEYNTEKHNFDNDYSSKLITTIKSLKSDNLDELIARIKSTTLPPLPRGSEEETKASKEKLNKILSNIKTNYIYGYQEDIINDYIKTKEYIEVVINILKRYYNTLNNYKDTSNLYDFIDIAKIALKILKEYPEIRNEIKTNLKEIMVDEYQDTSDIQEEFINLISNNNLYMVGDIKQSIYRFRNANPDIFKKKYLDYSNNLNGIKIDLLKNFRSRREVLDNINTIFNPIMDLKLGSADYYSSHQMVFGNTNYEEKKDNIDYNMEIIEYDYNTKEYSKEEIEFFKIAKDIKTRLNTKVLDKETNELRRIEYKDFCIIMDRNSSFDLLKKILSHFNIPTTLYKDDELNECEEIYLIKNIIDYLICLKKKEYKEKYRFSFTALARSYLFELSDNEIFNILTTNNIKDNIIYKTFIDISSNINTLSIEEILKEVLLKTNAYYLLIKKGDIDTRIKKLEKIIELSKDLNKSTYNIYEFNDFLDNILKDNEKITIPNEVSNTNSVKIMNIHKSKGLEFPITYFCGLYKSFSKQDIKGDLIIENNLPIYIPIFDEGVKETVIKLLIKEIINEEDISEKIRLFYVALTRAKEKMIFILPKKEQPEIKQNDIILDSIRLKYKSLADILYSIPNELAFYKKNLNIDELQLSKDYLIPSELDHKSKNTKSNIIDLEKTAIIETKETYSKSITELLDTEEKNNIELGLQFHETLEYLNFKSPNLNNIQNEFIKNKIKDMLNTNLFKQIKDANIYQEYEFIYEEDKTEYHGKIDLLLTYEDHIDIIDYKLYDIKDDAYIKQLNGYKKYIESISQKKVYTYLYSIISSKIKEVIM